MESFIITFGQIPDGSELTNVSITASSEHDAKQVARAISDGIYAMVSESIVKMSLSIHLYNDDGVDIWRETWNY